jgi:peptidoglycan/LPS O-acetylase OafA/YrhL
MVRGLLMALVVTGHIVFTSLFDLFRLIGKEVVGGSEIFVVISGLVMGGMQRRRVERFGIAAACRALGRRAARLYLIFIAVVTVVWIASVAAVPHIEVLTTWSDDAGTHSLFPDPSMPLAEAIGGVLLLRYTPSQFSIVGLFVCLALVTPVVLVALRRGHALTVLAVSAAICALNWKLDLTLTGAEFESSFPVPTWQFLFVAGLVAGYHRDALRAFLGRPSARPLVVAFGVASAAIVFFALNNPWDTGEVWGSIPMSLRLHVIPPETFTAIYDAFVGPRRLVMPGRWLGTLALLALFYLVLDWRPVHRATAWLLRPLGQASISVFVSHLPVLMLVAAVPAPESLHWSARTAIEAAAVLACWVVAVGTVRWKRRAASVGTARGAGAAPTSIPSPSLGAPPPSPPR